MIVNVHKPNLNILYLPPLQIWTRHFSSPLRYYSFPPAMRLWTPDRYQILYLVPYWIALCQNDLTMNFIRLGADCVRSKYDKWFEAKNQWKTPTKCLRRFQCWCTRTSQLMIMPQENCVFNSIDGFGIFEETQFDVTPRITENKSVRLIKVFLHLE